MTITIDSPTVPEAIRSLPRDARGFPVPWAQYRGDDGTPDFRVIDQARVNQCVDKRLCGICGEQLHHWVVFIGGPACGASRLFKDPAMHPSCAAFAAIACPFIAGAFTRYSTDPPPNDPNVIVHINAVMAGHDRRPETMLLYTTRNFRWHRVGKETYIKAGPFAHVDEVILGAERFAPARCPAAAAEVAPVAVP